MREWHEHAWGAGGDLQQASQPKELEECPLELRGAAETFWVLWHAGARGRMSLFPPEAEATAFTTLDELRRWYGLADEPWQAFHMQVGQPDMRILSALPAEALTENIMLTRVGVAAAALSPAHAVQIGLVWRLACRIVHTRGGGNYADWQDVDPWVKRAVATPAAAAAQPPALKERGIKMSSIIDQSDDSEFVPESLAKADGWYQRYLKIMGGPPQEEEDCTVEQLSALNKRVHTLDLPPYVDLGVWQPYGRRALRASKFRAWFPDGAGGYIAKELPGPSSWSQWLAAWRVFQTAAIMLDITAGSSTTIRKTCRTPGEALPDGLAFGGVGR